MFSSNDTFVEQVVRCVPTTKDKMPRYIFLALTIVSLVLSYMLFIFSVLFILFIILTYLFWNNQYEYEYDYTNGSLVIAKITNNSKRKMVVSVESANVRMIAKSGTNQFLKYDNVKLKEFDCISRSEKDDVYVLIAHNDDKNEDMKIFFNPNEKLIAAMKHYNKRDIYEV